VNRPDGNPRATGPLRLGGSCLAVALVFSAAHALAAAGGGGKPDSGPPRYAPEQIRASLERILAQPEYNQALAKWLLKVEEFLRLLQGLLQRFLDLLDGLYAASPVLYFVVMFASLVILLLILVHIGHVLHESMRENAVRGEDESQTDPGRQTPSALAERAEALAARGAHVDAIRLLFRSLVSEFRRQGKTGPFDTETNREFAMRWRGDPIRYEPLCALVRFLDEKWYGMQPCSAEDYRQCRRMYEQVVGRPGE
jgi:hypothetical protein